MSKQRAEMIGSLEGLYYCLENRRKTGRNKLFGKGETDRLRSLLILLRQEDEDDDSESFAKVLNRGLMKFFEHAGLQDAELREELNGDSLQSLRRHLDGVSDLCAKGSFGKDALNVTAEAQKIIMWIRRIENGLAEIKKHAKP